MSLQYLALRDTCGSRVLASYFDRLRVGEARSQREHDAVRLIQRVWRGFRDRRYLAFLHACATTIQRRFRGVLGRRAARRAARARRLERERAYYNGMATLIQKWMRGYLSRKNVQDFYRRRAYIQSVRARGDALERAMHDTYESQLQSEARAREQRDAVQFERLTENLHHLVSTAAIPGVFRAPAGAGGWGRGGDATAYDIPIETHIRDAFVNRQTKLAQAKEVMFPSGRSTASSSSSQHLQRRVRPPQSGVSSTVTTTRRSAHGHTASSTSSSNGLTSTQYVGSPKRGMLPPVTGLSPASSTKTFATLHQHQQQHEQYGQEEEAKQPVILFNNYSMNSNSNAVGYGGATLPLSAASSSSYQSFSSNQQQPQHGPLVHAVGGVRDTYTSGSGGSGPSHSSSGGAAPLRPLKPLHVSAGGGASTTSSYSASNGFTVTTTSSSSAAPHGGATLTLTELQNAKRRPMPPPPRPAPMLAR